MPAIALCDGAPSSIKAADFAGFPNFFVGSTDQLILVHAWNPARQQLIAESVSQLTKEVNSSSPPSSPSVLGNPSVQLGPHESMRLAIANVSPEVLETHKQCLPVPFVLHAHVTAIKESKVLKDVLNYKIETANVPFLTAADAAKADEDNRNARKQLQRSSSTKSGVKEDLPPLKVQEPTPEEITAMAATLTADYARQRAEHHKVNTIFMGIGNLVEGKAIKVGNTAEAVLRDLKERFYLYFIKNDGFTLRHTTTMIRYVVVVTVGNGSPPPPPPPEETEEDQAAAEAAGQTKEKEKENAHGKDGKDHRRVSDADTHASHSHLKHSPPPSVQFSNPTSVMFVEPSAEVTPPPPPPVKEVNALADGLSAVRYALARRREGHKDAVAVLLVVEPQTSEEEVDSYRAIFEEEIAAAPDISGAKEEEAAAGDAAVPAATGEAGDVTASVEPSAPAPESAPSTENVAPVVPSLPDVSPAADGTPSPVPIPGVELVKQDEVWPAVSVCTFKASKHVPQPTVWNSSQQIIKSLQQRKVEFAVFASSAPSPVMRTILSHNKPHVIVVPPGES